MADVKISALPTASVVNNADILVLNQGGTTKTAAKSTVVAGLATTSQISGLATTAQLAGLAPLASPVFSGTPIAPTASVGNNTTQIANTAFVKANYATTAQASALATAALSGYATTTQISGFTNSAQVQALASTQIAAITPDSIGAFATNAIIAIENGGTGAFIPFDARTNLGAMAVDQQATGGDISGLLTAPSVTGLQGHAISPATPNGGQILRYQNNNWEPVNYNPVPLDSPEFTGIPTAPTAAAQTNTTQIATTAFVLSNSGDRYLTTSTTSNTITNGSKTFTVASGLSYTPTQDITIVYDAANHMHGSVTSYSGTTLVVDIVQHSQTSPGPYTQWTINVGGLTNTAGTLLSANNLSDVSNTATALTNIGGVPTSRTVSTGTGLTGGGDLTANRTLSIAPLSPNPTGTYGSTSQIPSLTVNNLGQVTAVSLLSFRAPDVQTFSSPGGVYNKPAGARIVRVQLWSGGGGGGAGRKGAAGTVRCGGGGGGSGAYADFMFSADAVAATETVIVGTGGAGGASVTTNSTNGSSGFQGNSSSFGALLVLPGGNGATGGTTTSGVGGGGGHGGNTGAAASTTGAAGVAGTPSGTGSTCQAGAAGSGASGGGITSGDVVSGGATGGRSILLSYFGGSAGSSSQIAGLNAGNGTAMSSLPTTGGPVGGSGGGGGGSSITTNAGNGGNGGFPGGGGGGGGAALDSVGNSGAGGAGAAGAAIITTYF